jgi:hypothetical protein
MYKMKIINLKRILIIVMMVTGLNTFRAIAQNEAVVPPSNRSAAGLEKNLLFYADARYSVTQEGSISLPLYALFDGNYQPAYSSNGIDESNPYVITIAGLPPSHVQAGAWFGWTTRYWNPTKFKIEVLNVYQGANTWSTIANEENYGGGSYMLQFAGVAAGTIRLTVYRGCGPNNTVGISELFLIHNEATVAYDGLMVKYDRNGNVGIGTGNANGDKLAVKGNIHAQQVTVDMNNWADYVFKDDYMLMPIGKLAAYLNQHQHLPEIPSEKEVVEKGLNLGEMNKLLTKKVEELTLYLIEKDKQLKVLEHKQNLQDEDQQKMQKQLSRIQKQLDQIK